MEILELMKSRHSVRKYLNKSIEQKKRKQLDETIKKINSKSKLNVQIVYDDPNCFKSIFSIVGGFQNCANYIAMIGDKSYDKLQEDIGYYGEELVLKAQELGLNTCWVGLTHGKLKVKLSDSEKLVIVIALGYGANEGVPHKSKKLEEISNVVEDIPEWYKKGLEAALLAPTAVNQQKFKFEYTEDSVSLIPLKGTFSLLDAGIVKYHFDTVARKAAIIKK